LKGCKENQKFSDEEFQKFLNFFEKTDVVEFEWSEGSFHFVIKRQSLSQIIGEEKDENIPQKQEVITVKSNSVGIFHLFENETVLSSVGKKVKAKQKIGYIDCLGIPQEIFSPCDGKILKIFKKDEEVVEWGEPIFEIQKSEGNV